MYGPASSSLPSAGACFLSTSSAARIPWPRPHTFGDGSANLTILILSSVSGTAGTVFRLWGAGRPSGSGEDEFLAFVVGALGR